MKPKIIYIFTLFLLIGATIVLTANVVNLTAQKKKNLKTISRLNQAVTELKSHVSKYKQEKQSTQKKIDFFRYKENVFKSKYPRFSDVAAIVYRKSQDYGFSPYLIMALIQVESNFDPNAISNAGAYGLMQVNYSVWKDELNIDFSRIHEKEYNIDLGLKVLKHYYDKASGNMFMALYRYNNGYKYNNTSYNGKIVSTKFYSHQKESGTDKEAAKKKNMSI